VLPVQREVELGGASAEGEVGGQGREGVGHRGRRNAGDRRPPVHDGAVGLEHVEGALRVEHDADIGEHVERCLVDALHVLRGEHPQRAAGADEAALCVSGHGGPSGTADCAPVMNSFATKGDVTALTRAS